MTAPQAQGPSLERGRWLWRLRDLAHTWAQSVPSKLYPGAQTGAYVDLIFAFGLARLSEPACARELLGRTHVTLTTLDEVHHGLLQAYEYRIRQALEGKPLTGPLPAEFSERLLQIEPLSRYVIDLVRKHSRLLEPERRINPYRHLRPRGITEFVIKLGELPDMTEPQDVVRRVDQLLANLPTKYAGIDPRADVLRAALEEAQRLGEELGKKLLEQSIACYDALPKATNREAEWAQAIFLEKIFIVTTHFGETASVASLLDRFRNLFRGVDTQARAGLERLVRQCIATLLELGLASELSTFLPEVSAWALAGRNINTAKWGTNSYDPAAMRVLLHCVVGWSALCENELAEQTLKAAWRWLIQDSLPTREQTALACAYAEALGATPRDAALPALEEMLSELKGVRDTYTTATHFSLLQLDVVEAVVLAAIAVWSRP